MPVISPEFDTVAMALLLLVHVPPDAGDKVCVAFTQILLGKFVIIGKAFIRTLSVVLLQPIAVLVNVKVTLPCATGVITPALFTVATAGLLLNQVPPVLGVRFPVAPIQICVGDVTGGEGCTVTRMVLLCLGMIQADRLDCIST